MARPETAQDHARLVHHAEGAGDAAAVLALAVPAGARAAALGAHRVAAAQYARASQLTARLPARDAAELLQQHAYECYLNNHLDEAAASQRKALTHWSDMGDRLREVDALRRLSRIAWFQGDRATAERHGQAAVTLLRDHAPESPEMARTGTIERISTRKTTGR
jgi:predicted hydrolase (HD superfamily)